MLFDSSDIMPDVLVLVIKNVSACDWMYMLAGRILIAMPHLCKISHFLFSVAYLAQHQIF